MQIKINPGSFFIFDLDDTLYQEVDFLKSGFMAIALKLFPLIRSDIFEEMCHLYNNGANVFKCIIDQYHEMVPELTAADLLKEYRNHMPDIKLRRDAAGLLEQLAKLSVPTGLITDGRSITQRNKIKALHLENYFQEIIISEEFGSEKPDERNYQYFSEKYPGREFYFVGDNTSKDFIIPSQLGWGTICLKSNGTNIHPQSFDQVCNPVKVISSFDEIEISGS